MATIDTSLFPSATFKVDSGEAMPVTSRLNALRESQMGDIKFRQAQQEEADNMLLRQAYNVPDPVNFLAQQGRGDLVPAVKQSMFATQEAESKLKTQNLAYDKAHHERIDQLIGDVTKYTTADQANSALDSMLEKGEIDPQTHSMYRNIVVSTPWPQAKTQILGGLRSVQEQFEVSQPTTEDRTNGQSKWQIYSNPNLPNYGQEVPKSRITLQLTPAEKEDQRQFNVTEKRLSEAAKAKTQAPEITTRESALAFLKEAGYDAKTDKDDVSLMLPESTSGFVQKVGSELYGGVFGESTKGQEVLGKLESRASKLVLNLLGGKLGAGISNPDREFMTKAVGDIGNANLPSDKRLSAWTDLMLRMKAAAGVVPANIAPPVPGGASVAPSRPSNVPAGAKYSPSQKKWFWQDASGAWKSN